MCRLVLLLSPVRDPQRPLEVCFAQLYVNPVRKRTEAYVRELEVPRGFRRAVAAVMKCLAQIILWSSTVRLHVNLGE